MNPRTFLRGDRHQLGLETACCRHCGMVLIAERPEDPWFDEFYARSYWPLYVGQRFEGAEDMFVRDRCAERAREILDGIHPSLPVTIDSALDVGCGQGGVLAELRRRYPNAVLDGIEPSRESTLFCSEKHGIDVTHGRWEALERDRLPGPYDLITMVHVVEHVLDPVAGLTRAVERLAEDGRVYVEVPDLLSNRWRGLAFFHIAHVWCFAELSLRNLFSRAGLEVLSVHRGLAAHWPWAVGAVGRKSLRARIDASAVPAAPRGYRRELEAHVLARCAPFRSSVEWVARRIGLLRAR